MSVLRVGYDATMLTNRAGIGRYSRELLRALVRHEPGNEYLLMSHARTRVRAGAVTVARLQGPALPWRAVWVQAVLPVLQRIEPLDVCHFTNYHVPLAPGRPYVVTLHDLSLLTMPHLHPRRRAALGRSLIRMTTRGAAAVVTPSHAVREEATRLLELDPVRVHVVPEAPAPLFRRIRDEQVLARTAGRYGLRPGFLLTVGTLEPRKNLEQLLAAYVRLRSDGFGEPLVLCGARGWATGPLMRRIADTRLNGAVRLLGHVPDTDLPPLLSMAGAFAYLSVYEGFGLPAIEALACGTPTVASDRGAIAEVTAGAAVHADPADVREVTDALSLALTDERTRRRLRTAGPARASAFTWELAAHRTAEIYQIAAGMA
jgi:glycosyltransferase involved in cell wall biosynthesis